MSPYERRVVHSVLASNEDVTTISEGKEPMRRVVIIPKDELPYERREKRGGRQFNRDKKFEGERKFGDRREGRRFEGRRERGERNDRERGDRRERPARSSAPRGKKQIFLGTYLGNSGAGKQEEEGSEKNDQE